MMNIRSATIPNVFLLAPLAVSAAAVAVLIAFPSSQTVWQLCAWSLALAALLLVIVLPATAYSLVKSAAARTRPRGLAFALGILYMAVLVFGALSSSV